jgi:methionyl aminopeptidase
MHKNFRKNYKVDYMDKDTEEKYIKAGKIASEVREEARKTAKEGMLLLELGEKIESRIKELGGEIAFPINLSINEIAAHYTPTKNDETKIPKGSVLKIDVGVHVDGYVADTACTVCFDSKYDNLTKASKTALEEAIKVCKPGAFIRDVSAKIEETIKGYGLVPVSNLTGHGLEKYFLHASPQIPNVKFIGGQKLSENQVIAIEPFATDGAGRVKDSEPALIYMLTNKKPVRNMDARKIISFAEQFNGLPFAERWISFDSLFKTRIALKELKDRGIIYEYPPLKEVKNGMVSQHEHTVIVRDEPVVTTL